MGACIILISVYRCDGNAREQWFYSRSRSRPKSQPVCEWKYFGMLDSREKGTSKHRMSTPSNVKRSLSLSPFVLIMRF